MRSLFSLLLVIVSVSIASHARGADSVPAEPVAIGSTPQFLFDQYIVDNHWALKITSESFQRVLHLPRKSEANPRDS